MIDIYQIGFIDNKSKGLDTGLSQIAKRAAFSDESFVIWNFPIDTKFKATNPFGWPRIAVSVILQYLFIIRIHISFRYTEQIF